MESRHISTSLAVIVFVCFFLPWVQLSCGGSESRLSGVDIARDGRGLLWLIPCLMLLVVFLHLARVWKNRLDLSGLAGFVSGLISAYLMNRERVRAEDTSGLVAVGLTGWFWLGLGSSLALAVVGALRLLKRPKVE